MRKRIVLFLGLCMTMLAGCGKEDALSSYLNTYIENSVMKDSNIESDKDYQRYKEISQEEVIDPEGYYISDDVDYSVLEDPDAVHVTFANNSYITVTYFDDPAKGIPLEQGGAYLHGNDCIYAEIIETNNPNTDAYQFSGFEIWEFDESGKKKRKVETEVAEDGLIYQISMESQVKEISIIPLGEYVPRNIELKDYYKDNNGAEHSLEEGTWDINGNETTNSSTSISPVASYTVRYMYDPNAYEFVGSNPTCLYNNEIDGIVNFEEFSADQEINSFCVELRKKSGDQEFDPSKYKVEHAEIEYKYQGVVIVEPTFIPNGSKISYEVKEVEKGYWVPSGNKLGEIEISSVSKVISNLVCKEEKVKVTLPQPERGGTITYSMDGNILSGVSVDALIGTEISMTFKSKNGWTCEFKDGTVYKVTNKEVQRVNVDGKDVNNIFTEQQYKPLVTLTVDKSVGIYTEFTVEAVDMKETGLKLENEKKNKDVFREEVGTKNDLAILASNGSLLDGEALKFDIQKETVDGTKENDIEYLKKIPENLKVSLYIANNNTVYKSVNVTVSKVKVAEYSSTPVDNGYVSVKTTDISNNRYLKPGDVIEDSRKVEITISAKNGYYIKDSGKTELYSDTMKYSKYMDNINTILTKHPVKKYCELTLDLSDSYGTVSFKIDGKAVEAGSYSLKEEQNLEISYEITDGKHVISRETANWIDGLWDKTKSKTKETAEIAITSVLDGGKVSRDMYIKVENK